jgi:phenylalanyl-tRNA synthetase alpha chain
MSDLDQILTDIRGFAPKDSAELEAFRLKYLGSKGLIKTLFARVKDVPAGQKKEFGQQVNAIKASAEAKLDEWKEKLNGTGQGTATKLDTSLPTYLSPLGSRHPLSIINERIIDIFTRIGFGVAEGPEIEDDWHNFTALNMPPDHPARDMQDTFFVQRNPDWLLRTHTSPVQVRTMQHSEPPVRIISPGRVYRRDNDSTHSPVFHQVEGIYVDENVSFADLKQTLYYFVEQMFGIKVPGSPDLPGQAGGMNRGVRLRASYFPFTEPSAELDIEWERDGKKAWMEILGCGMVHPKVLENCGIDSDKFTGFAFGMGVERIAMLKYGIPDIRLFYENDVRFLAQFS